MVAAYQARGPPHLQRFISSSGSLLEAGAVCSPTLHMRQSRLTAAPVPLTQSILEILPCLSFVPGQALWSSARFSGRAVSERPFHGQEPGPVHGVAGPIIIPAGWSPGAPACLCNAISSLCPWQSPLPSPILQPQGRMASGSRPSHLWDFCPLRAWG